MAVDSEGYPATMSNGRTPKLDSESGELLKDKVIVLRSSLDPQCACIPSTTTASSCTVTTESLKELAIIRRESQSSRGFRIHRSDNQTSDSLRQNVGKLTHDQGWSEASMYRTTIDLTKGIPSVRQVSSVRSFSNMTIDSECGEQYRKSPMFKVPIESVPKDKTRTGSKKHRKTYYVNIWKEFMYGPCLMMIHHKILTLKDLKKFESLQTRLRHFFHNFIVDVLLYIVFYGTCFMYCLLFNYFLAIGLSVFFSGHLSIHQVADAFNMDVSFVGSVYQGPSYVLIRFFCKHCDQKEEAKVILSLMKKMKQDILNSKVS